MGRRPTKAADNPFCKARLEAAKYNDRLYSKEGAAELLGLHVSTLSDYELDITKVVPVDKVLLMADLYNAPELKNHYCREVCPLGYDVPKVELDDLDRITLRALAIFRNFGETKDLLLDITADGVITKDEKPILEKILQNLSGLESVIQSFRIWVQKNMEMDL